MADIGAAALTLENIVYLLGDATIIDGVSLSVARGEVLCLLGQSGCGKTTLLRIAAGLERPASGRVLLGDVEVAGPDVLVAPERRSVGLMFQDYALFPHLTVAQNVKFGLLDKSRDAAGTVAREALVRVGLAAHGEDYPHMLSGGEQQRAALARALAPNPTVLLMDEPFSNLDQRMRERIRDETIELLRENRITAVVVTHDPVEAMQIADRIALMRRGRLVQVGTSEELYLRPRTLFAARFFCDLNEIQGVASGGDVECRLGRFKADGVADGPAIVCLRPRALHLVAPEGHEQGRVVDVRFLGETQRLRIAVEGLDKPLQVQMPADAGRFEAGQRVGLAFDHAAALVFAGGPGQDDREGCRG